MRPKACIYKAPKSLVREHVYRICVMVLETRGEEFHVALWRVGEGKLGLKLAVAANTLRVHAITGSRIEEMSWRCRTCRVKRILEQQLLEKDELVSVNGETELSLMLAMLGDVKVACYHMRVRRHLEEAGLADERPGFAAVKRVVQNLLRPDVLVEEQQHQPVSTIGASASGIAAASAPKGLLRVRVIISYDPWSEPEMGYLGVVEGTMVTVQLGSRSPPEARNWFRCDYVYAWKMDQKESRGWLPVDILPKLLV